MTRMSIRNAMPVSMALLAALAVLGSLPRRLPAQEPSGAGTQQAPQTAPAPAPPAVPAKTTLADLSWLAGSWQGTWGPRIAQQVWMTPKAGTMVGAFQLTEKNDTLVIELFSLSEQPHGIELHLRHFTDSLTAWENDGPASLALSHGGSQDFVFENPRGGQPKRIVLRRIDADTYVSRSEIAPRKGPVQVTEIIYHRLKSQPARPASRFLLLH